MSTETNNQVEPEQEENQYTEEEVKQIRSNMTKFYTEEIKFLKKQEEYERLLADIEEHKVRKYTMMQRAAQMFAAAEMAQQQAEAEANGEEGPLDQNAPEPPTQQETSNRKRKLKTVDNV